MKLSQLFESRLTPKEKTEINDFLASKIGWDEMSEDTQMKLHKRYESQMPYGTVKARTGDPDQWIFNHITHKAEKAATATVEDGKHPEQAKRAYRLAIVKEINSI